MKPTPRFRLRSVVDFVINDNPKGLFPLTSVPFILQHGEQDLRSYVYDQVFDSTKRDSSFAPFPIAYAMKDQRHLRRCLVLDPIASFYLYDFIWRNREIFSVSAGGTRRHFGYSFQNKNPVPSFSDYHRFRRLKYSLHGQYEHFAHVDIANCFNSFYHHDIASFVSDVISQPESEQIGQFLREGNSGRTVGCFPQGIYPAKTMGNFFLAFIEQSREIESEAVIRFLDDVFLFSNDKRIVERDLIRVQHLIGEKGMSLNSAKTRVGERGDDFQEGKLDDIKRGLLKKRERVVDYDEGERAELELDDGEVDYLRSVIQDPGVAEEDVELALSLLTEDLEQVEQLADIVVTEYPHLLRPLYKVAGIIESSEVVWRAVRKRITESDADEFELFWIAKIAIDHLDFSAETAECLHKIFGHARATPIVKAVVLEITANKFGLQELKEDNLRAASSGLLATSAAVGLRNAEKSRRNHTYMYAGKTSQSMKLVCDICKRV